MGRRLCAAAVSGAMRHEALTYGRAAAVTSRAATGARRSPGLRGTAPVLRRRAARPHGGAHPGPAPHGEEQSAAPISRKLRFSVTSPPGRRGARPPRQPAGHYGKWSNWANALGQPPRQPAGWLRRGPQASAWGPVARKDAVWTEGLAEGVPRVRPGHHQAPSCGLRGAGNSG